MEKNPYRTINKTIPLIIILGVAVFVTFPWFSSNFIPTHDGEYSIIRFWQFYLMISQGNFFPVIAPTINNGSGLPIFLFFYPFSNYVGALLHVFGASFVDSVKYTLGISYIVSLFGCFYWLTAFFPKRWALSGTLVGAFIPYWFVEMYVRGSVPEMVAFAVIFLLLASIERKHAALTVALSAILLLSHNIIALLFFPLIILYALSRNRHMLVFVLLSLGVASYFLIPAFVSQQYVTGLNTVTFSDHFAQLFELLIPSWGTGFSGQGIDGKMSFQIGVIPFFIIVLALFLSIFSKQKDLRVLARCILGILLVGLLMTTGISRIFWDTIPLLPFVQHPWRFLSYLLFAVPFLTAYVFSILKPKGFVMAAVVLVALGFSFSYMRPNQYQRRSDAHYLENPNFRDGTISMGNSFSTKWMTWSPLERQLPKVSVVNGRTTTPLVEKNYTEKTVRVTGDSQTVVTFPVAYFPGWDATVDGKQVEIVPSEKGHIDVPVPPGEHSVTISFGQTNDRVIGMIISLMSLMGAIILVIRYNRYRNSI